MSSFQFRLNRRRFLTAVTASFGALSLRGYPILADAPAHFTHGVASGDPLSDRVILWTRVLPGSGLMEAVAVDWEVATDEHFRMVVASGSFTTDYSRDFTVKVDASGLLPNRRYFYRFNANGVESPVGRTRTLADQGLDSVKMAVVSCSNYPQGYFHVYRELANRQYDVVLHLGDYIYEYAEGGYANPIMVEQGRGVEPKHEIVSLEDYRLRYGLYRSDPDLQAVHQAHPFICVWDDHEISNNTWMTGAQNHNDGEGEFDARRLAAIKAFHEWLPIREQGDPVEGRIHRSFEFGDLASLIMLDTRLSGRDEQLDHVMNIDALRSALADQERRIMGIEQEQWLEQELARSAQAGKPWQIIGQQVLMGKLNVPDIADEELDPGIRQTTINGRYGMLRERGRQGLPFNLDAWDGYPANRDRVFRAFAEHANNVVVLTGDTHSSWGFDLADESGKAVAVEFGTPSVTSPGFENFVPVPQPRLEQATLQASPELKHFRANGRGWLELDITAERVNASYQYVSTVHERGYRLVAGGRLVTHVGESRIRA